MSNSVSGSLDEAFAKLMLASDLETVVTTTSSELDVDLKNSQIHDAVSKYLEACSMLNAIAGTTTDASKRILLFSKVDEFLLKAISLLSKRAEELYRVCGEFPNDNVSIVEKVPILSTPFQEESQYDALMRVATFYELAMNVFLQHQTLLERIKYRHSFSLSVVTERLEDTIERLEQLKKNPKKNKMVKENVANLKYDRETKISLNREEIQTLFTSSTMASGLFMPWDDKEILSFNRRVNSFDESFAKQWKDPDGFLKLSKSQRDAGYHKWARPSLIASKKFNGKLAMIRSISPYKIKQTCVTDCSFIASLCICAAYEMKYKRKLVTSLIYPQDKNKSPILNPEGKYMVKFWLNGIPRRVIVDDFLPVNLNMRPLCSHVSSYSTFELWVPIIEKAYMKLCGGYDFPGSNSAVDMFSLTGWIPERIFFAQNEKKCRDYETPAERAWDRLKSASKFGDCLITVSTSSELTEEQADRVGLVTAHAYAVLSVFESTTLGVRLLQLKNPWMKGGWKGKYSATDIKSWSKQLQHEVGYKRQEAMKHEDGVFWICWNDVLHYFSNMFLSWNPDLFQHKITTHAPWPKEVGPKDDSFNAGENPQYIVSLSDDAIKSKATVWILLSRHVKKQEQEGAEVDDYLTLHVYRGGPSKKVWYLGNEGCLSKGAYSNSPHVLTRIDLSGKDKYLSLVLSQHKKMNDLNFSLSVYCTKGSFTLRKAPEVPSHKTTLKSEFGKYSCEGSRGFYELNPMFDVNIPSNCLLQIQSSAPKNIPINFRLEDQAFTSRLAFGRSNSPIFDSGDYRNGFVATDTKKIPKGRYTLVASTFYEGQLGPFVLKFNSSVPISVKEVPTLEFTKKYHLSGSWSFHDCTACGSPNHGNYTSNPMFLVKVDGSSKNMCHCYFKLDIDDTKAPLNIASNLTIFSPSGSHGSYALPRYASPAGKACGVIASSGGGSYISGTNTVHLKVSLKTNSLYILVPSTFNPEECKFELLTRGTSPLSISRFG